MRHIHGEVRELLIAFCPLAKERIFAAPIPLQMLQPCIAYQEISLVPVRLIDQKPAQFISRYQVTILSETLDEALTCSEQIYGLDEYNDKLPSIQIYFIEIKPQHTNYDHHQYRKHIDMIIDWSRLP